MDTSGLNDYDRLRPLSYVGTDVILMCFAIENHDSLANIYYKWSHEMRNFCRNVPIILVGTKKDLRNNEYTKRKQMKMKLKPITLLEGQSMAKNINAIAYFECSAMNAVGVQELFEMAASVAMLPKNVAMLPKQRKKRECLLQ